MSYNATATAIGAGAVGCYIQLFGVAFTTFLGLAFWVDVLLLIYRFLMSRMHWVPGRRQAYLAEFIDSNIIGLVGYIAFYVVLTALVTVFHALGVSVTPGQALYYFLIQPISNAFNLLLFGKLPALPACG